MPAQDWRAASPSNRLLHPGPPFASRRNGLPDDRGGSALDHALLQLRRLAQEPGATQVTLVKDTAIENAVLESAGTELLPPKAGAREVAPGEESAAPAPLLERGRRDETCITETARFKRASSTFRRSVAPSNVQERKTVFAARTWLSFDPSKWSWSKTASDIEPSIWEHDRSTSDTWVRNRLNTGKPAMGLSVSMAMPLRSRGPRSSPETSSFAMASAALLAKSGSPRRWRSLAACMGETWSVDSVDTKSGARHIVRPIAGSCGSAWRQAETP